MALASGMAALVRSSQSNVFHQSTTIKCATCSKPLKVDELGAHVCPKLPPATLPSAPVPSRTPSPLAPSRVVSPKLPPAPNSRDAQTPTPRAVPPPTIPRPLSPPAAPHAPQTAPLSLKRSATENVTSVNQRSLDAGRGSRPPGEMVPPGSPRRSMTTPTGHRGGDLAPRVISQSSSFQFDFGSGAAAGGGRDSAVPTLSIHIPDTETGGQAGRAGVGRRAFAAVAQATLLATSYGHNHGWSPMSPMSPLHSQDSPYGIPSGRFDPNGRGTPTLSIPRSSPSPRIPEVRTPSPGISVDPRVANGSFHIGSGLHTPISPSIPGLPRSPLVPEEDAMMHHHDKAALRGDGYAKSLHKSPPPQPRRSSTIESDTELSYRDTTPANEPPAPKPSPPRPGTRRADTAPDAFGRSSRGSMENVVAEARVRMLQRSETTPLDPSRHVDDPKRSFEPISTAPSPKPKRRSQSPMDPAASTKDSIEFPSGSKQDGDTHRISTASSSSSYTSPSLPDEGNNRLSTLTTSTARLSLGSSSTVNPGTSLRRTSKSAGSRPKGLKLPMETVEEEGPATPTNSKHLATGPSTSGSANLAIPSARERTKSGPSVVSRPRSRTRKRSAKTCIKCGKNIDDGRWIAVDATAYAQSQQHLTIKSNSSSLSSGSSVGDVLCEEDWKAMYLPKCRRCGSTIESQAVSSADGQLKGKYHRACFHCSICHKPFPHKEFYVFAGQPYCEYHYHVSNNSLCASPSCGKPIEGPCAEDHEGRRYHPEHLLCNTPGCKTRLVEYFCDGDGRKFCERHAQFDRWAGSALASIIDVDDDHEDDPQPPPGSPPTLPKEAMTVQAPRSSRAEKRRTRFLQI